MNSVQIFYGLEELPPGLGATAVTIGNFDGVHQGHQHVLAQLTGEAARRGVRSVVVTFDPHPAFLHRPEAVPELLTGLDEKLSRLASFSDESSGIDAVLVLKYTAELAAHTAEAFVQKYFVQALQAAAVVVGHDVRFGRGNSGDFSTMTQLGQANGFAVVGVEDFDATGPDGRQLSARCSSTAIRTALAEGDVAAAAVMLGRPHAVVGEVVHGEARGRELGFPTANISRDSEGMIPADGVYAGWLTDTHGQRWPAAISVGSNPTFEGVARVVEAHVIDREQDSVEDFNLYGQRMRVEFVQRLRGMVAYEGVEKLIAQMREDVDQTRQILRTAGTPITQ
ncbi:bifunctional riboflavin kinase/FAD synthetase [Nesterenkonia rhizosphaerae]|uniref:bifunctional riboflavin kinase/FAD synthetase n=1 Tax=Nesterenkonia rhizosphaerae TaxID=1348272 RepID=UPI003CD0AFC6